MTAHVRVDPVALEGAAAELDALATRLQASLAAASVPIQVIPSGSEEVSLLANRYFKHAAGSYTPATHDAIGELIETAAALRTQASAYRDVDLEHSRALDI
ncbi:PE family protein [Rhodococcoides kyotonense]|uniref:PE family protein n=1 Tax=Rhodococcoides kyotonense TaxID=398843 RepID=A0A239LAL7_9NOCA|nr:PE family protein [Rhodococcus kyotonensis]SNT27012.1 PE family protein [Rhodococcus kyotonensis]